jgi:hypothetical protein
MHFKTQNGCTESGKDAMSYVARLLRKAANDLDTYWETKVWKETPEFRKAERLFNKAKGWDWIQALSPAISITGLAMMAYPNLGGYSRHDDLRRRMSGYGLDLLFAGIIGHLMAKRQARLAREKAQKLIERGILLTDPEARAEAEEQGLISGDLISREKEKQPVLPARNIPAIPPLSLSVAEAG